RTSTASCASSQSQSPPRETGASWPSLPTFARVDTALLRRGLARVLASRGHRPSSSPLWQRRIPRSSRRTSRNLPPTPANPRNPNLEGPAHGGNPRLSPLRQDGAVALSVAASDRWQRVVGAYASVVGCRGWGSLARGGSRRHDPYHALQTASGRN